MRKDSIPHVFHQTLILSAANPHVRITRWKRFENGKSQTKIFWYLPKYQ